MKVLISGGRDYDNAQVFRRAMGVIMSDLGEDKEMTLYLAGPYKTNDIARQFVNLTESSFKSRGRTLNYQHVSPKDVPWDSIDAVVALVNPPQRNTALGYEAEDMGKEVHVFRY